MPAGHQLYGECVSGKHGSTSQIVLGLGIVGALVLLLSQGSVREQVEKTLLIIKGSSTATMEKKSPAPPRQLVMTPSKQIKKSFSKAITAYILVYSLSLDSFNIYSLT